MNARRLFQGKFASRLAALSARASLLAALALPSLLGCADEDELGGKGNHAGSSSGAAAGHGAGARSGAGGESGVDGESGEGGEGGSKASRFLGCDGLTEFQPNPQIVRSCVLRAGCDPSFAPVRTISTCVTYNTQAALPGEACNLGSMTCADFERCEHIGVAHDDLCGGNQQTRCEGELAVNCGNDDGDDRFFDCAALGGTCATFNDEGKRFADCKLDVSPDSCSGLPNDGSKAFCHSGQGKSDDLRYYCWDGQAFGSSCSSHASCIDAPDSSASSEQGGAGGAADSGNALCYFETDSCQGPDGVSCNGGIATVCSGGSLFKYDCGSVGLACAVGNSHEYCLAPGCGPADVDVACKEGCSADGSRLSFCYGGLPYSVECADYGFTHCASDTDAASGQPFAACRF